ncbi:universal stress protein [Nocardia sp. NEAU-G5]|uniref:Universal stress protein n=1 Tax=Nocardia albiluteola TaxID=2842303 RepID=A0ABS6AY00_9NOCA|nr:universal stress protein [Nocardia albiluteola]MBU3062400.1 universal stress protein [Nocardia albiluteola]
MNRQSVVVGVDGTTGSLNAARWAAHLAHALHVPLSVVHLDPRHDGENPLPRHGDRTTPVDPSGVAEQAVGLVRTAVGDLDLNYENGGGAVDSALIERSGRARYMVIGMHPEVGSGLIGRTTMHVVTRAHCPVLVWRGAAGHPIPRRLPIVVAVDGTPVSESAVDCAFELAAAFGVPVTAVHVRPPGIAPIGRHVDSDAESRALLSAALAGPRQRHPGVPVAERVVAGATVPVLARMSAEAQLLVVGSRSRGSAAAVLLGSVSRELLHRSSCPVLVCRDGRSAAHRTPGRGDPQ